MRQQLWLGVRWWVLGGLVLALAGAVLGTWLHTFDGAIGPLVAVAANALLLLLAWRTEARGNSKG